MSREKLRGQALADNGSAAGTLGMSRGELRGQSTADNGAAAGTMGMSQGQREQWLAQCLAQVLLRLHQRQRAELVLSLAQLTQSWPADAALRHARLKITQTTPAFLHQLANGRWEDTAQDALRQAWRDGMQVRLEIDSACFGLLPVAGLLRLRLRFCTPDGWPVHLLARRVACYADIRSLPPGYLVVARHVLLTALARDEIVKRGLQLYRQD